MPKQKCPKHETCSAPLCPLELGSPHDTFFIGEEICKLKRFQTLGWVKKQRALVKAKVSNSTYFTIEMLKSIRRVTKSLEGIDPDLSLKQAQQAEEAWIKAWGKPSKIAPEGTERPKKASVPWNEENVIVKEEGGQNDSLGIT